MPAITKLPFYPPKITFLHGDSNKSGVGFRSYLKLNDGKITIMAFIEVKTIQVKTTKRKTYNLDTFS